MISESVKRKIIKNLKSTAILQVVSDKNEIYKAYTTVNYIEYIYATRSDVEMIILRLYSKQ